MKKSLAVILASTMVVSLTACGSPGNTKTSEPMAIAEAPKTEARAEGTGAENGQEGTEAVSSDAEATGNVMLYSSMQEDQLMAVRQGFEKKYPNVKINYYSAGTGKVITKIVTEHQSGQVATDVIWMGDLSSYTGFRNEGIPAKYSPPEADAIADKSTDPDRYYTGAHMMNMSVGYNITLVMEEEAPKTRSDLLDPKQDNQVVMTDPSLADTTKYLVGTLPSDLSYGEEYFKKLKENGCELESDTIAAHDQMAVGAYKVGAMPDCITQNLMDEDPPLGFRYLDSDLASIFSPIGLAEGCANDTDGRLLCDFILSKEGQEVLVDNNLLSIRDDVDQKGTSVEEIVKSATNVDLQSLPDSPGQIIETSDKIFK